MFKRVIVWVALGRTEREKPLCVNQEIEDVILVTRKFSLKSVKASSTTWDDWARLVVQGTMKG